MHWLSPLPAIYAASAAVPLLLLLYFLKLRRHEVPVPSTLLWKRAVQDLQVNAPIQRLRMNLLLLLQFLALAAVLCALGQPVLSLDTASPRRYVILVDRSASMGAMEDGQTRLSIAKQQAKDFVQTLRSRTISLQDTGDQAMVIAFDRSAKVMCKFTTDKRQLALAIDAVEPGDSLSSLAEAVLVAQASAQSPGLEANNRSSVAPALLELFSDGKIQDAQSVSVGSSELHFHAIGKTADNVAVTAMQVRRSYEKPEEVTVFAVLANYNAAAVDTQAQLSIDGVIRSVRPAQVPPLKPAAGSKPASPGTVSVTFNLTHNAAGVVEVRQLRKDALPNDDAAWAILSAPRRLSVLLATSGNLALESALRACPLAKLDLKTPAELEKLLAQGELPYNLTVLDRCSPAKLPRGRYMIFGRPPSGCGASVEGTLTDQVVVDWRSRHSILQFVNLSNLYAAKAGNLTLPRDAEVLAEFAKTPAIAIVRKEGSLFLLVNFDLMDSNWPFEPSFVMFCYNATGYLGMEVEQNQDMMLNVGQPITMSGLAPGAKGKMAGPGVEDHDITADPSGAFRFAGTDRAGVYLLRPADKPPTAFAVNLLDERESFIEPAHQVNLMGQTIQAQNSGARLGNLELWPFLAALALLLVCVEWLIYNARAKL
jgi:hypothetical protein